MKIKKICLIVNWNQYETKLYFTQKLSNALRKAGVQTLIIKAEGGMIPATELYTIKNFEPDFTFSFNYLLPLKNKTYLWDLLDIPHAMALVDPALYCVEYTNSPNIILSCVDRTDVSYLRQLGFKKVFFWPHAVDSEISIEKKGKDLEVIFTGSCYDYETLQKHWRENLPQSTWQALEEAAEIVLSEPETNLAEALATAWNRHKLDTKDVEFNILFFYLDNYTRGKDRVELIRSIKNVPVHIFGALTVDNALSRLGWEYYAGKQTNITLHSARSFREIIETTKRAKICLNSTPFFKDGSHERVLNALACGALPITSPNRYLKEEFGSDILFYEFNKKEKIEAAIESVLSNDRSREEAIERGRQKVRDRFDWGIRAEQLIEQIQVMLDK